jgi:hypothetical protein
VLSAALSAVVSLLIKDIALVVLNERLYKTLS